jgi:hypothetical protein
MEPQLEVFALAPLIDNMAKTIELLATKNEKRAAVSCHAAIGLLHADQIGCGRFIPCPTPELMGESTAILHARLSVPKSRSRASRSRRWWR